MNNDGVKRGYDLDQLVLVRDAVSVPVIASGGAGDYVHFADLFEKTGIDGGLAASVFHSGQIPIPDLKHYLRERDIEIEDMKMTSRTDPEMDWRNADWDKGDGLLPAIVQDAATGQVLMLGYMNRDAADATIDKGLVTFFSRSSSVCGRRARAPATILHLFVPVLTATAIPFWSRPCRPGQSATPARGPASPTICRQQPASSRISTG